MQKSKIVAMVLAAVLLASTLFACANSEQDKKFDELTKSSSSVPEPESQAEALGEASGEVTLLTRYSGQYTSARILAQEFNKTHPDLKVKVKAGVKDIENATDADWDNFKQRLATELMGGDAGYGKNFDN